MHKPESVFENETNDIFMYYAIQTDRLIPTRRPEQILSNRKKLLMDFAESAKRRVKMKEGVKLNKFLDLV